MFVGLRHASLPKGKMTAGLASVWTCKFTKIPLPFKTVRPPLTTLLTPFHSTRFTQCAGIPQRPILQKQSGASGVAFPTRRRHQYANKAIPKFMPPTLRLRGIPNIVCLQLHNYRQLGWYEKTKWFFSVENFLLSTSMIVILMMNQCYFFLRAG